MLIGVKITNIKQKVKTPSDRLTTVYQIKATEDFDILTFNGVDYVKTKVKKGDLGGYVERGVTLGDKSWLHHDTIVFGETKFEGVTCGYARIEDSTIDKGAIIGGRTIIIDSSIGAAATIFGTTSIRESKVKDNTIIVGTIIRQSKIEKNVVIRCAGAIDKEIVKSHRTRS